LHCLSVKKNNGLFLDLLRKIDFAYPLKKFTTLYVVVDNYKIHKAKAVLKWLCDHPRFELLFPPTYCPRANPIERAFGDVHDNCTRNHKRKRLRDLVKDVGNHLQFNGPWNYQLSKEIYYDEQVTAELEKLAA
jgi:transposase